MLSIEKKKNDELILMHFYRNLNTVFNEVIAVSFGKKSTKWLRKWAIFVQLSARRKKERNGP